MTYSIEITPTNSLNERPKLKNDINFNMSKYYSGWADSMKEYHLNNPEKKFIDYVNDVNYEVVEKFPDVIVKLTTDWGCSSDIEPSFMINNGNLKTKAKFLSKYKPEDQVKKSGLYGIYSNQFTYFPSLILNDYEIISAVYYKRKWIVQTLGGLSIYYITKHGPIIEKGIGYGIFHFVHYFQKNEDGKSELVMYYLRDGKIFNIGDESFEELLMTNKHIKGLDIIGIIEEDFSDMDF